MKNVFFESTIFEKYRPDYLTDEEFRLFQSDFMSDLHTAAVI